MKTTPDALTARKPAKDQLARWADSEIPFSCSPAEFQTAFELMDKNRALIKKLRMGKYDPVSLVKNALASDTDLNPENVYHIISLARALARMVEIRIGEPYPVLYPENLISKMAASEIPDLPGIARKVDLALHPRENVIDFSAPSPKMQSLLATPITDWTKSMRTNFPNPADKSSLTKIENTARNQNKTTVGDLLVWKQSDFLRNPGNGSGLLNFLKQLFSTHEGITYPLSVIEREQLEEFLYGRD